MYLTILCHFLLNLFQVTTTTPANEEFDPVEVFNFVLILIGILTLIIILAYILLTSREEQ